MAIGKLYARQWILVKSNAHGCCFRSLARLSPPPCATADLRRSCSIRSILTGSTASAWRQDKQQPNFERSIWVGFKISNQFPVQYLRPCCVTSSPWRAFLFLIAQFRPVLLLIFRPTGPARCIRLISLTAAGPFYIMFAGRFPASPRHLPPWQAKRLPFPLLPRGHFPREVNKMVKLSAQQRNTIMCTAQRRARPFGCRSRCRSRWPIRRPWASVDVAVYFWRSKTDAVNWNGRGN